MVRDFRVFLIDAVMRTTGMTAIIPLGCCWDGGCRMFPLVWMYSSVTGIGSATSHSSSEICKGFPVSRETILMVWSVHACFLCNGIQICSYLSQEYSAHQTRLLISASNGGCGPRSLYSPISCAIFIAQATCTRPVDRRFISIKNMLQSKFTRT
jgi:hypothetical protein